MDPADAAIQPLDLAHVAECMPGLLPEYAVALAYAAAVCLEEEGHAVGVQLAVSEEGDPQRRFTLSWPAATDPARRTWADADEATEQGACAVAAVLVKAMADLLVVHRSRRGTGFDYWVGSPGQLEPLFQQKARLEVSGIRHALDDAHVRARERQKVGQVLGMETAEFRPIPRIVVIVDFGMPRSRFRRR